MKLSHKNVEKMIERCTKKEIDVMVYLIHRQNEEGVIKGIYYNEVVEVAGIKKSTFFTILKSLERKEMIDISSEYEHAYWTVQIIDNIFITEEDCKKGYLNFHHKLFYSNEFKQLTKGEKVCAIKLFQMRNFAKTGIKVLFRRIMEWTGKSLKSAKKFAESLGNVFKILKKDSQAVTLDCHHGFSKAPTKEKDQKNIHLLNYIARKCKCQSNISENNTEKDIKDVINMMDVFSEYGRDKILSAIMTCLQTLGSLAPAFINTEIRK